MTELKEVKKQNKVLDKKVTTLLQKNDSQEKILKEISAQNNKNVQNLNKLLSPDGVKQLKKMCLLNLDLKAKDEAEMDLLAKFMEAAKDGGWIMKHSAKAESDVFNHFRKKRNYLKSQIRLRFFEDLSNKTAEQAGEMPITMKFLQDTLGVVEIGKESLLVIYNYAYIQVKYLNKTVNPEIFTANENKILKKAKGKPWMYTLERVEGDKNGGKDFKVI